MDAKPSRVLLEGGMSFERLVMPQTNCDWLEQVTTINVRVTFNGGRVAYETLAIAPGESVEDVLIHRFGQATIERLCNQ